MLGLHPHFHLPRLDIVPSNYWIKLYHEILDDPKMGRLPDHLWRRAIELFLLAGDNHEDGHLPAIADIAWRLRSTEAEVTETLEGLANIGMVHQNDQGWTVTHFAKRQAAVPDAERSQHYREAKRKASYYGNEQRHEAVTIRDVDTDTDTEQNPKAIFSALAKVCAINWSIATEKQKGQLNQTEKKLRPARASPQDIQAFGKYWYAVDWRGKKGDAPRPAQVREEWGKFRQWQQNSDSGVMFLERDKETGELVAPT